MSQYLLAFAILFIAILAMAIGALAGREPIRGSCGGIGNCGACRKQCSKQGGNSATGNEETS